MLEKEADSRQRFEELALPHLESLYSFARKLGVERQPPRTWFRRPT